MFNKIRGIKYAAKIGKLVEKYAQAEENSMNRVFICWEANRIKSECANLVMNGKLDVDMYATLFKSYDPDGRHFLDRWLEEK